MYIIRKKTDFNIRNVIVFFGRNINNCISVSSVCHIFGFQFLIIYVSPIMYTDNLAVAKTIK